MIQRRSLRSASAVGLGRVSCAVSLLGCVGEGFLPSQVTPGILWGGFVLIGLVG